MNSNEILKKAYDSIGHDLEVPKLPDYVISSSKLALLKVIEQLLTTILSKEKENE